MDERLLAEVRAFLGEHNTLSLATSKSDQPWAASLFFVSDDDLNLYFVSDGGTRHAQELSDNPRVAATVNVDCRDWTAIRGIQIEGRASPVPQANREAVLARYLEKFTDVAALFNNPRNDQERKVAARLSASAFYCVTPSTIRLIDNSKALGTGKS